MNFADSASVLCLLVREELLRHFGWVLTESLHFLLSVGEVTEDDVLALGLLDERQVED